jgi:cytochrome b6-f complex iron-sulfur subunit
MSDRTIDNAAATVGSATPEEHDDFTRRGFVKVVAGGVGLAYLVALGYPIYRYLHSPVEASEAMAAVKEVGLKDADKLPKGSALMFKFGLRPSVLIHHLPDPAHPNDEWVALTAVCTHMGCTVAYNPATNHLECHCHGGVYDANSGDNISGPPPRPLKKYLVKVAPGIVTVSRT